MTTYKLHNITADRRQKRLLLALSFFIFHFSFSVAQTIKIGGNVYGGGNSGDMTGSTNVTILAGDINNVFGGARQANVGGRTFVNLDGEHASDDIFIVNVYGGNDISGTIGEGNDPTTVPTEMENVTDDPNNTIKTKNYITNSTKSFVHTSACPDTESFTIEGVTLKGDSKMLVVGSLFGGSNGDYDYTSGDPNSNPYYGLPIPILSSAYLEIKGGCIAHVYGGGNNATVNDSTLIHIENGSCDLESTAALHVYTNSTSKPTTLAGLKTAVQQILGSYKSRVNMATFQARLESWAFNHARVFGGNNKATMAIMPKWNLQKGIIRDLYSGGNQGKMTSSTGLLLEIDPSDENQANLKIENVFGGCRMANVEPMKDAVTPQDHVSNPLGYSFPVDLAARTLVRGGDINNVYGGNDISGKVFFGNAVGIYTSIRGNVYGGGNGSYAYTDNVNLKNEAEYRDFYYEVPSGMTSVQALTAHRPNAEQVSVRLWGKDADHPTIIGGSVYVGGNSATLEQDPVKLNNNSYPNYPVVELKIGSNVYAENVFLGNNGENMVKSEQADDVLRLFGKYAGTDGELTDTGEENRKFNTINFKDGPTFAEYMKGCAMTDMIPGVVFDNREKGDADIYEPYSSYIGSFYCGGNVGSMIHSGVSKIDFTHKIIIYNKLVGGCNSAVVPATDYNAVYEGGVIGSADTETGNKLELNLSGLLIQPKRWAVQRDGSYNKVLDANDQPTYLLTDGTNDNLTEPAPGCHRYLEWNTVDSRQYDTTKKTYTEVAPVTSFPSGTTSLESSSDDLARRLYGGNIYGGCYSSGIVEGNVVINLNATIVERDKLFDEVQSDELGEEVSLYGSTQTDQTVYNITQRNTGVILGQQGMDVFGSALNVFGGGKGEDTEIWGSTTINLNKGYTFQIFGGSEDGVIGKPLFASDGKTKLTTTASNYTIDTATGKYAFDGKLYDYNPAYSCYVNICGENAGVSKAKDTSEKMAECEFLYGGGFFGPICGNTISNIGKGRVFNSFGGSCNADILGHSETYVGRMVKDGNRKRMGKLGSTSTGTDTSILDNDTCYVEGFPWVRDIVYGGNDLGGRIMKEKLFQSRLRTTSEANYGLDVLGKVHPKDTDGDHIPDVLKAGAYVEYLQGRADAIFGGCYGTYNYSDSKFNRYLDSNGDPLHFKNDNDEDILDEQNKPIPIFYKPRLNNAFVNFRPTYTSENNVVKSVYGAGQGQSCEKERDLLQNRSYVLIDIPQIDAFKKYTNMEVFGAGAWGGVGMGVDLSGENPNYDAASAIVDLVRGEIGAAYGASFEEGVTRRTLVNVPRGSTIRIGSIFGGGYGMSTYLPCDAYEANVEYHSADACLIYNPERKENNKTVGNKLQKGAIYGGNNNERRTLYGKVNIDVKVQQDSYKYGMTTGTVYGAGCGGNTWSEYTEVNLNRGANVWEVYGGGEAGKVYNAESVHNFMTKKDDSDNYVYKPTVWPNTTTEFTDDDWDNAWKIGGGIWPVTTGKAYWENTSTNLANPLVRVAEVDDRDFTGLTQADLALVQNRYCTNVIINEGAYVGNYAYGGGLGAEAVVAGTTYIALLGGEVRQDIYAAGTSGSVEDTWNAGEYDSGSSASQAGFTPSANVYIEGGTVRNVYGGGWRGNVGKHVKVVNGVESDALISEVTDNDKDRFGEAHVIIGKKDGTSHVDGIPSITRNVYGGGEGGAIYGTAYVTVNKGYIGYRYKANTQGGFDYVEELHDKEEGDSLLYRSGNIFGGGYVANSYVDNTDVKIYGGIIRGSVYGGGEVGPIGRGSLKADAPAPTGTVTNGPAGAVAKIYKPGTTHVEMYKGHVLRNVFGGGRGHDNWGGEGWMSKEEELTMDRSAKGYVFGQTQVYIHGGEIGTDEGMAENFGNVFGGCDVGYVYSAYAVNKGKNGIGKKSGNRFDYNDDGYYYKFENGNFVIESNVKVPTEDCKVVIGPNCKVEQSGLALTGIFYPKESVIPALDLNYIKANPSKVKSGTYDENGKVLTDLTFDRTYNVGEFVSTYALHTLKDKSSDAERWKLIDDDGIIIHNAVFAGGNVSSGSTQVFANATTVYGNATASIHDVYHRDLITIGTGHTGGLYGEGNLTFVDGYRGLNITNYGTDYYNISMEISLDTYKSLPKREQAYYELKYTCIKTCTDINGKTYHPASGNVQASSITADELQMRFEGTDMLDAQGKPDPAYWEENGVCSRYAGRIMNTIQRADFCGVFGSRMVMQGAQDRVPETVDRANYTINRVREVSLNKKESVIADDIKLTADNELYYKRKVHGNYFGIYNNVNFLGALTSDVFFNSTRTTNNGAESGLGADGRTFYEWKEYNKDNRKRNRGTCHNELALASGVYLELTTDNPQYSNESVETKDWGYINGVIELDLINVQQGIGGGFVYAKNVHGVPTYQDHPHATLTALNAHAVTRKDFSYTTTDGTQKYWETSGNFIHDTQTIIDDCYPVSNRYTGNNKVPAHYWYIKGTVYIYDQYISAYTGAPNAYSKTVNLPLTITAASHGQMRLMDVKPNRYAYWADNTRTRKLGPDDVLELNGKEYRLNDPITYWDYNILNAAGQRLFVEKTYVTIAECEINGIPYPAGYVMMPDEYNTLRNASTKIVEGKEVIKVTSHDKEVDFDYVFRESNNLSHDKGYILTYEVNNPEDWNTWYTPKTGDPQDKISSKQYSDPDNHINPENYNNGPTYKVTTAGLYGQNEYSKGDIIAEQVYTDYSTLTPAQIASTGKAQAVFAPAYVVTKTIEVATSSGKTAHLYPGATVVESDYTDEVWASMSSSVEPAYVCTSTLEAEDKSLLLINTILTSGQITTYSTKFPQINEVVEPAYSCTTAGSYGGKYYTTDDNNRGLAAWSSMSPADREKFKFNYDALNLLIDETYGGTDGEKYQYDGKGFDEESDVRHKDAQGNWVYGNKAGYSVTQPVDYTATYNGTADMTYTDKNNASHTIAVGAPDLSRTEFEALPNEQRHYTAIKVPSADGEATVNVYVVHKSFIHGDTPYAAGQTITINEYKSMNSSDLANITTLEFDASEAGTTYFFCRESYTVNENGEGKAVTNLIDGTGFSSSGAPVPLSENQVYNVNEEVPVGVLIKESYTETGKFGYNNLTNRQTNFTIHGVAPVETSTLYVSRESDIYDLSTEKIITVIYEYNYEEADESGLHVSPVCERHVVNIHITFQSGVPEIEDISAPNIVLPGTLVNLRTPNVTPGAYEVTGGGWMLFEKESDTESHNNGIEYTPTEDPLYWYQNKYWVAYYAQTYLGKTFSNAVQVSVANFHNLADVMADHNKKHHMYIDDKNVDRDPKIYITTSDGLDLFKNLYDLSLLTKNSSGVDVDGVVTTTGPLKNHTIMGTQVRAGSNLEFFLRTDLAHADDPAVANEWTPIGNDASTCFEGILHGDGHTISGLDNSLFNHLCGEVYNLGVTGSFTGAGVAETGGGYVENCWVKTTGTPVSGYAVFGNPSRTGTDLVQVVNSYYPESNAYTVPTGDAAYHGVPTKMPDKTFYNGTVAYDLNGFYLNKRYYDGSGLSAGKQYSYWKANADGSLATDIRNAYYPADYAIYPLEGEEGKKALRGYVEERFADGDFIYVGDGTGEIPTTPNERLYTDPDTKENSYHAIWPDDYIFFGQTLSYDHMDGNNGRDKRDHQPLPSVINKGDDRVLTTKEGNRVYRAPAYFRNYNMGVAHFNPYAVFAATKKDDPTVKVYENMTAIDFTGYNDASYAYQKGWNKWSQTSQKPHGSDGSGKSAEAYAFYPPLLDDGGVHGLYIADLTRNLLAYTMTDTDAAATTDVTVGTYLHDDAYVETETAPVTTLYHDTYRYHTVDDRDTYQDNIRGHRVQKQSDGTFLALNDHVLIDKNDFNAPMEYSFAEGQRMWYQRLPDNYVDIAWVDHDNDASTPVVRTTKGWEGISLPFKAEIVTTNDKGEITHFYSESEKSRNSESKLGHEYWLREFKGGSLSASDNKVFEATFQYPNGPLSGDGDKDYTNTFLWDYYYSHNEYDDQNSDDYQENDANRFYYKAEHTYKNYPRLAGATPYIIGFPGKRYYEFDLSGEFEAVTAKSTIPDTLGQQTITFASKPGATTIRVSDNEMTGVIKDNYTFQPSYLNSPDVETGKHAFLLNSDGNSYVETDASTANVYAFRPYFIANSSSNPSRQVTRSIVFADGVDDLTPRVTRDSADEQGGIIARPGRHKIMVSSTLKNEVEMRIVNAAGQTLTTFTLQPGETHETRIINAGVYIVQSTNGHYIRKVAVR